MKKWVSGTLAGSAVGAMVLVSLAVIPTASAATVTVAPSDDSYVRYDAYLGNYGGDPRWSTEGRGNIWRNAMIKFDVDVPSGEVVTSAKVRAYSESTLLATEFVDIYEMSNNWEEETVTWTNAPARGTWLGKQGGFATDTWVEWDVTDSIADGLNSFKFETNAQRWTGFKSKEHHTPALRPHLVITTEPGTPPPPSGDGTTAAAAHNWGNVVTGDEFNYTGAPDSAKWSVYDSAGHAGNGIRSPQQASVNGTHLNIDGTADGTTAGLSAKFANQKYGRWEARMKASGDEEYHMVGILWPDSQNWPCDGEIDYAETTGSFSEVHFFNHYSCSNLQTQGSKTIDVTQFHNYAVDWSPSGIVGYIDGVEWFRDEVASHQPPGSMHQTLQLDWFPDATANGTANMQVDWVRVYEAAGGTTPPPPSGNDFNLITVGDMNPSGHTDPNGNSGKNGNSIKAALDSGAYESFIGLGDFQYSIGHCGLSGTNPSNDHYSKYHVNWGAFKDKTYWTAAPNHDYEPGRNEDLDNYMDGGCVNGVKSATSTDPTRRGPNPAGTFQRNENWYSFDKGNWHILVAPSALWRYNPTKANAITSEMDANLAAAKAAGKHLAVVYHEPYFTSKTSSHDRAWDHKPWIDMFWKNRVRVLLSGSQHNYERSCPVNNNDQCVADGMQQFQVSTGGISLRGFSDSPSYIAKRFSDTWGHLRMTLKADGSYNWQFVPTSGGMQTDGGSRSAP